MTIKQRIDYLLSHGYTAKQDPQLIITFTSPNGQIRVSFKDVVYRWNSIMIF